MTGRPPCTSPSASARPGWRRGGPVPSGPGRRCPRGWARRTGPTSSSPAATRCSPACTATPRGCGWGAPGGPGTRWRPPPGAAGRGERRRAAGAGGGRGLRGPAAPAADGAGHRGLDGGRGGAAGLRLPGHGQLRRLPPEEPGGLVAGRPEDRRRRDDGVARTLARTAAARRPAAEHRRQPPTQARPPQRPHELPPDLRRTPAMTPPPTRPAPEPAGPVARADGAGRPSWLLAALPAVLLLFALVVALTQAWRWWHEVPTWHMDGAFQTASGLYRLADGQ